MAPKNDGWYATLPAWAKVTIQLGFAGVVAFLFVCDSRDRANQLRDFYQETRIQAKEDRILFRSELQAQREELKAAVTEMKRAVDHLDANQKMMKKDVDELKYPFPKPREK